MDEAEKEAEKMVFGWEFDLLTVHTSERAVKEIAEALRAARQAGQDEKDAEIHERLLEAGKSVRADGRKDGLLKAVERIKEYWTFDNGQVHTHTWHDKQDCLAAIRKEIKDEEMLHPVTFRT